MSLGLCRGLMPLILLAGLAAPAAAASGVEDNAGLFSQDARVRANDLIEEIRSHTRKDLLIATVKQLPAEKMKDYQALKTQAERDLFFRDLATERAQQANVDGVYVLLCRVSVVSDPRRGLVGLLDRVLPDRRPAVVGHAVVVWPESNDAYFPASDRQALDRTLARMGDHNQDQVLGEAVGWARDRLEANARIQGAPPLQSFHWTTAVWAAAGLAVAWAVAGRVRARVAARQGGPALVPGANQVQAPLFGTAAALWLFEAYRARRSEPPSPPAPEVTLPPHGDSAAPDVAMHPDDLAALARGPDPWASEGTEAAAGHELP